MWPSSTQLRDRRFASYTPPRPCPALETAVARAAMSQELEAVMTRHFMDEFYWLILLPDCHPDFMHGWIADMQRLMLKLPSLRYSILACAAAHLHVADMSPEMEQLTLSYYAKAVSELSTLLNNRNDLQIEDDHPVLICIILLYIQGVRETKTRGGFGKLCLSGTMTDNDLLVFWQIVRMHHYLHGHSQTRQRRRADPCKKVLPISSPAGCHRTTIRSTRHRKRHLSNIPRHSRILDGL